MQYLKAIKCPKCGDVIYSRCRHDFHTCSCGECSVDGGFDYFRTSSPMDAKVVRVKTCADRAKLYADWNSGKNRFGVIHPRKKREET